MVVQADGASYALDSSPERTRQALGAIASTGRQALAEMRRMLGVLRSDDGGPGVVPQPGIGQLGELLDQTRASGLAVSFTVQGVPGALPSGLALAAYRIIQESLTNTRKHGGPQASARVLLRYCEDLLMLQITDDGQGAAVADGAGHGRPECVSGSRSTTARCAPARCPAAATRSPQPSRSDPFPWPIRPRPPRVQKPRPPRTQKPRPPRTQNRLPTCQGPLRERTGGAA